MTKQHEPLPTATLTASAIAAIVAEAQRLIAANKVEAAKTAAAYGLTQPK